MQHTGAEFQTLVDEFITETIRLNPVGATQLGIHTYDGELGDFSAERYSAEAGRLRTWRRRLEAVDPNDLTPDGRVDWHLLADALDDGLQELEYEQPFRRRPDLYANQVLEGIYLLLAREFAPPGQRAEALLQRMQQIPQVLAWARQNLDCPAALHVQVAADEVDGGVGLFTGLVPAFAAQVPQMEGALMQASDRAAAALAEYGRWLREQLLPRAGGEFALGRARFDWKLKHLYKLPYDCDSLHQRGLELVQSTLAEMDRLAAQIEPGGNWRDMVARARHQHPPAAELLATYRQTVADARRFMLEHDLVAPPPGDELQVVETPPFMRPSLAYAAYLPAGPFEARQEGCFFVTPVDLRAAAADQAEQLTGHNWPSLKLTVLHEAYPGHHVQLSWANQHPSKLRKLMYNSLFGEGWTLYCEQMMDEQGWLATPLEKMFRLKDQLWRACRIVLDTGLHARGLPVETAIQYLSETAAVEAVSARTEVVGYYCRQPTVPMSYLIGKEELLRLQADYQARRGGAFSLRQFHTDLLAHGSIPFFYLRQLLLGEANLP